jgi:hypothetical protein
MSITVDAAYFREKVRVCLALAKTLPWNNPARYQLLLMAEEFQLCQKQFEWIKVKNPSAPAVKREAEEDWGR